MKVYTAKKCIEVNTEPVDGQSVGEAFDEMCNPDAACRPAPPTVQVRIPVMVREDGAFFVWEMDTSNREHVNTIDQTFRRLQACSPFYVDLDGNESKFGPHGADRGRHGEVSMAWVTATIPLPRAVEVEGEVES